MSKKVKLWVLIGFCFLLLLFLKQFFDHRFDSVESLQNYMKGFGIAAPLFPDDFLCYFSGLIKMNSKKFIWIIILGKPWCILAYSIMFGLIK